MGNSGTLVFNRSGDVTVDHDLLGGMSLVQQGPGKLILAGTNTYSGTTTINGGTLEIGGPSAIPCGWGKGNVTVNGPNGTLDLHGHNLTVARLTGTTGGKVRSSVAGEFTLTVGANDQTSTFAGVIENGVEGSSVGLTKTAAGTLTLTGDNTYSHGTTISAGTLQVGNDTPTGALGSGSGVVLNDGSLVFNRSIGLTIANAISGSGTLSQTGTGTLTLTGDNTYSGTTTINAGSTLAVGGTTGAIPWGNVVGSGTLGFNRSNEVTVEDVLSGSISLVQQGPGKLILTAANDYSGTTTINGGTLEIGGDGAIPSGWDKGNVTINGPDGILDLHGHNLTVAAVSGTTGGKVRSNVAGEVTLAAGANDQSSAFAGVIENGVAGSTLGLTKTGEGTLTLTGDNTYSGTTTINAGSTLDVGGTTGAIPWGNIVGSGTLRFNRTNEVTVEDVLSGSISLVQQGTGMLILTANNTYSGTTTINGGSTLQVGHDSALGTGTVTVNGTLDLNQFDLTVGGLGGNGAVTSLDVGEPTATLTVGANNQSTTFSGVIQDGWRAVALAKEGTGSLTLTGTNTYSDGTTISGGTLRVGNNSPTSTGTLGSGSGGVVLQTGATLEFNRYGSVTIGNCISGSGALRQTGSGTLTLTGENTYTGTTTISQGTLCFGSSGLGSTASITFDGGILQWAPGNLQDLSRPVTSIASGRAAILDTNGNDVTITSSLSGAGGLTKLGAGTLTLGAGNSYSGTTTINGGTLQVSGSGTLGSGSVVNNASLVFNRSGSVTVVNAISGTGDTTISAGTVNVAGTLNGNSATILAGAALEVNGTVTLNTLSNQGTVKVVAAGRFNLGITTLYGTSTRKAGTDAFLSWSGLGGDDYTTTYTYEVSTDGGQTYLTLATGKAADFTATLSGLKPSTTYRLRVVAESSSGARVIYDGETVSTDPEADTSGWYQIKSIKRDADGSQLSLASISTDAFSAELPQGTPDVLGAPVARISVVRTASTPSGPSMDDSWTYAGSPQEAVSQSIVGLVTDGSAPHIDPSGKVKVWHVWYVGTPETNLYTFERDKYPPYGGVSAVWYSTPYTIEFDRRNIDPAPPPRCPSGRGGGCGAPSADTGGALIPMNAIDSSGGAAACGLGGIGGLTYASRETTFDSGYGLGWSDVDELPALVVGRNTMAVRFGAEQAIWFDLQADGSYAARYGAEETLVHDSANHLFVLTQADGTRYEFFDAEQTAHPRGGFCRSVTPSGATVEVTGWTEATINGRIAEVQYKTESADAYHKRQFVYVTIPDGVNSVQRIQTLTLSERLGANWTNVRRITYDYYGTANPYGLPGDLKTIVTQQWEWNGTAWDWTGDDTNYFRYYVDPGKEHLLKRVVLANAYAALYTATGGHPENATETPEQGQVYVHNYTCFYYEYDAQGRVTRQVSFGNSKESNFSATLSTNADGHNNWHRKTVETRLDGSTNTVFTNFLGEPILTDLQDSSGRWVSYNRYDGAGRLLLSAEPSAFVLHNGDYYDDSLPDLIGYAASDSPYLSDTEGLFQVTVYYSSDGGGAAEGYVHQEAVAHGETAARLAPGSTGGPVLLASYTYTARTVDSQTVHPIASQTTYRNEDGTGPATTHYAYPSWYSGTFRVRNVIIARPVVSVEQNGSGQNATAEQWFDSNGQFTWSRDELGRVTYTEFDWLTGQLKRMIEDIDAATATTLSLTPPANWTLPASGGANLVTDYLYDALGRIIQTLGPKHTIDLAGTPTLVRTVTWTVYRDANHETRSAQGYVVVSTGNAVIVGPVSITKTDRDGRTTERIQATCTGTLYGLATAAISQSDYTAWTTYQYSKTRLVSIRVYDDIPSSGIGTAGVNYDQTTYGYENHNQAGKMGRLNKTVSPAGTITRYVLDAQGNVLSTWVGTNDTGASDANPAGSGGDNNMIQVGASTFDADGNLAESHAWFDSGANDYYATEYKYDWRNRLTDVRTPAKVVTHYDYDNLGQSTDELIYADADNDYFVYTAGRITGTNEETAELRAQSENFFDNLGRIYESRVYEVAQQDAQYPGTAGDYLVSEAWYDPRGLVAKTGTGGGLFRKFAYDGVGRLVASHTSYDAAEHGMPDSLAKYQAAMTVDGDTVIEQSQTWYDGAGQAVASATYQRLPDDTTTSGALTAANSYATAAVVWYDGIGRAVRTADYGREDKNSVSTHYFFDGSTGALIDANSNGIPDAAEVTPHAPNSSDNYIVGVIQYNDAGRPYRRINNLGRIDETQYDDAGRVVRTIQNRQNGTVEETDTDQDVTVEYQYDSRGRLVTMTAYNAKGSGAGVQAQATRYLYESPINASWQTAVVYPDSADTLSPDGSTGGWTITADLGDHVSTQYDRLGRVTNMRDQRGVVHVYAFDTAGRFSADVVSDLGDAGQNVDGTILRIGTAYDDIGRVRTVTSYSDAEGVTPLNQVKYLYNGWGQVAQEYQEHDALVDGSTLYVQYDYDTAEHGARLKSVRYPNGRRVHYTYGAPGGDSDRLNRVDAIQEDNGSGQPGTVLARYKYLGAGTVVEEDYVQPQVRLDYLAGGSYGGFDRFGRVVDQLWESYSGTETPVDRYRYGYDRAGNRTWRENVVSGDQGTAVHLDELYSYDGMNQLTGSQRGDLNAARDAILTGTERFRQDWTLDGLGNWSGFTEDTDGDGVANLDQTRAHNAANEVTGASGWATPAHDRAGNMTSIPSPLPGDADRALGAKYDAWNRLVQVSDGGILVAKFSYDGTGGRIFKQTDTDLSGTPDRFQHFFHDGQQVIETRQAATVDEDPEQADPEHQFVWSPRYIDSLVLRDEYFAGDIQPASRLYYLNDANYNVTALLDNSGDVVERYVYSPYGKVTIYTPIWSSPHESSARANTTLYTGRELDLATGLYYYRARYYSADLGNFVNRDPISYKAGDPNLYRYGGNQPTILADPSGLAWWNLWISDEGASQGQRIGTGAATLFGNGFELQVENRIAQQKLLIQRLSDPNSSLTVSQFRQERLSVFRGGLSEAGQDAYRVYDGVNAAAELGGEVAGIIQGGAALRGLARNGLRCGGKVAPSATKPLGLGSTGRTAAANLKEQLAMKEAMSRAAAGRPINVPMTDPRWPASQGWVKMSQNVNGVEVHYLRNTITGALDDFKFK